MSLDFWLSEIQPVLLIVYHTSNAGDVAYWVYIQNLFEFGEWKERLDAAVRAGSTQLTIHVPASQTVNAAAFQDFRRFKRILYQQAQKVISHDAE